MLAIPLDAVEVVAVFGDEGIELGSLEILHFDTGFEIGDGRHGARSRLEVDRIR